MIYGYARVSTVGQARDGNSLEKQQEQLKAAGAEKIYLDAYTGTKKHRPEFDKLMTIVSDGDTVIVTKLDRIARSATQGLEIINSLLGKGVKVYVLNMGILDNTPNGKLMRTMMLAFAEFERDMIIERTREGKDIAKRNPNFREGRPRKFSKERLSYAVSMLENQSYKSVSRITGISVSTLQRAKRELELQKHIENK